MSVVTFKFIESYQEKKKIEIATLYFDGLQEIKNKNYEKAEVLFKKLIKDADKGYTVLSYFKLANINLNKIYDNRVRTEVWIHRKFQILKLK